ncbi:MAG: hypothetical protein NZ874_08150 [Fimbriimonadales bacterium]|nr:hypothetical protein [Fimbriimonadales bacterium]
MAQTQVYESAQAPQQFTPDEAIEILKQAATMTSQQLSIEQLETIADEAGIPRENLYQAVQQHLQRADASERAADLEQLRARERRQRRNARLKRLLLLFGLIVASMATISISYDAGYTAARQSVHSESTTLSSSAEDALSSVTYLHNALMRGSYDYLERLGNKLDELAVQKLRGSSLTVYIMPPAYSMSGGKYASIWVKRTGKNTPEMVLKISGDITRASLSSDDRLVAFFVWSSAQAGVWVLDLDSGERHWVLGAESSGGYGLPQDDGSYAQADVGEVSWIDDRTLMFSTTHGRYVCKVSSKGVPLRYEPFDE